jgi:hypothetical protein
MNKANYIAVLLVGALMTFGCTEEMDLQLDTAARRLVVEGYVTTDTTTHYVKLTYSGSYFENKPMQGVSDAVVTLNDGTSTVVLNESASVEGLYLTPIDYYGVEGRTYTLDISGVDVNGDGVTESYSANSFMNPSVPIDDVVIGYHTMWDLWQVLLYAKDPADTENYYMFKVWRNDSLVNDALDEVSLADDAFFDGSDVNGVWVMALDSKKETENLHKGDIVKLEMACIDKTFYDFLVALQEETSPRNPLFSGPPANVPGNISNGAIGIFAAYSVDRDSALVTMDVGDFK